MVIQRTKNGAVVMHTHTDPNTYGRHHNDPTDCQQTHYIGDDTFSAARRNPAATHGYDPDEQFRARFNYPRHRWHSVHDCPDTMTCRQLPYDIKTWEYAS